MNKQWFPNSLVILTAVVSLAFLVLFYYLRITLGANTPAVLLVGNLWLWFGLLMIAVLYFYKSKQLTEKQEILQRHKYLLRNLFLVYGAVCIVALLWSVWVLS